MRSFFQKRPPSVAAVQEAVNTIQLLVKRTSDGSTAQEAAAEQLRDAFNRLTLAEKGPMPPDEKRRYYHQLSGLMVQGRELFNLALSDDENQRGGAERFSELVSRLHGGVR